MIYQDISAPFNDLVFEVQFEEKSILERFSSRGEEEINVNKMDFKYQFDILLK